MNKALILAFLVSGCATALDYQKECEKIYPAFTDMTVCLKDKINADPRADDEDNQAYVQRYLLEAEKLSELVKQKKISELDARIRLSDLYLQLKNAQESDERANVQNWQTQQLINNLNKPRTTSCFGNTCTTY